jgi:hypothetical protein
VDDFIRSSGTKLPAGALSARIDQRKSGKGYLSRAVGGKTRRSIFLPIA